MDSKQIHDAMKRRMPVTYKGEVYDRVLEYISFYDDGRHRLSAVLLKGRTSYRVPAEQVELWKGE